MYFDHAATTPLDSRLLPILEEHLRRPHNPSSIHGHGQSARRLLEEARERLASLLGLPPGAEVLFTSGATEAANLALRGLAAHSPAPPHFVLSAVEHACLRDTAERLALVGSATLTDLPLQESGRPRLDPGLIPQGTDLLCLMHSNNETGVIQDTAAALRLRDSHNFLWLCDSSQSLGKIPFRATDIGADLYVFSSHKAYGPVGVGCLAGTGMRSLVPQITGGPQEHELRAGTQPLALILAFVAAAELAVQELQYRQEHLLALENAFLGRLRARQVPFRRNGTPPIVPGFLNISLSGLEAADAVIALDQKGLRVSPGSACSTGVVSLSPVLAAMFPDDHERAAGGIRITFGKDNRETEAIALADAMAALGTSGM